MSTELSAPSTTGQRAPRYSRSSACGLPIILVLCSLCLVPFLYFVVGSPDMSQTSLAISQGNLW
jgi:hypothetical protein